MINIFYIVFSLKNKADKVYYAIENLVSENTLYNGMIKIQPMMYVELYFYNGKSHIELLTYLKYKFDLHLFLRHIDM